MKDTEIRTNLQILRYLWPVPLAVVCSGVLFFVMFTKIWSRRWFIHSHLLFEVGAAIGIIAAMVYSVRLWRHPDLAPRWVFYLNFMIGGSYVILAAIQILVTYF